MESDYRAQPGVDAVTSATYGVVDMGCIRVTLSRLKYSAQKQAAQAFAAYCVSPEAAEVWKKFGFNPPCP